MCHRKNMPVHLKNKKEQRVIEFGEYKNKRAEINFNTFNLDTKKWSNNYLQL